MQWLGFPGGLIFCCFALSDKLFVGHEHRDPGGSVVARNRLRGFAGELGTQQLAGRRLHDVDLDLEHDASLGAGHPDPGVGSTAWLLDGHLNFRGGVTSDQVKVGDERSGF